MVWQRKPLPQWATCLVLVALLGYVCLAEDIVETWSRPEFVQVPGGVCPYGNWPSGSDTPCSGSVLYGCLPSWTGVIDFVDATPANCTLDWIQVLASGSFGCSDGNEVTATLNDETVVGRVALDTTDLTCGCTEGADTIVLAEFDPIVLGTFHFMEQNIVQVSATGEFCACLTNVRGTFRCDLDQDEHVKYLEQQVLEQLFQMTNGRNWYNSGSWLEGNPCDNHWHGITCDAEGHVASISLSSNNLNGVIPDLSQMTSLVAIEVMNNRLFGSLPHLPRSVQQFFFSANNFQGSIPDSYASLDQVQFFNVDSNYLTGSVTQELIHGLVDVIQFSVSDNFLNGTFPSDLSRNLRLLELTLSHNQFTGPLPSQFASIEASHLQYVSFDNNLFSGPLPGDYSQKIPLMTTFTVANNRITGNLPGELASLPRLLAMDISNNRMTGVLPDDYNARPGININARGNDWTCPLPQWCSGGVSSCGLCSPPLTTYSAGESSSFSAPSLPSGTSSYVTLGSDASSSDYATPPYDHYSHAPYEQTSSSDAVSDVVFTSDTNVTSTRSSQLLNTSDLIVVVTSSVIFALCGVSIVIGILVYLAKKKQAGELELPSFMDDDDDA